jgi:hypothetical protein
MVEMGAQDHIFVFEYRIGAGQDADHVRRLEGARDLSNRKRDRHQLEPFIFGASRLQAHFLEPLGDIACRGEIAFRDREAALQRVVGQIGDVRADAIRAELRLGRCSCGGRGRRLGCGRHERAQAERHRGEK